MRFPVDEPSESRRASGNGWLRRFTKLCGRHRTSLVLAFAGSGVSTALTVGAPLVVRHVVDLAIGVPDPAVGWWIVFLVGIGVVRFGASCLRRRQAGKLAFLVERDLRVGLYQAIQRIDAGRLDGLRTGQVMSRSISDVLLVQNVLQMLPLIVQSVLTLVLASVIIFVLSPVLTLLVLGMTVVLYVIATRFPKALFAAQVDVQERMGDVTELVDANLTGAQVVKGFGQEQAELDRFGVVARALYLARLHLVKVNARFSSAFTQVPALAQAGVLVLGGLLAVQGHLSIGTFVAFATYLGMMIIPVRMLSLPLGQAQEARACLVRIFELTDVEAEITDRPGARELPDCAVAVEFDGVRFGYGDQPPVLDGVSLRIEAGETVAVVGRSGVGKSTLTMLVPRFYDVSGGTVRLDGVDVRDLTLSSVRKRIGVVFDETFLFSESIRDNIALGRRDATEAEVVAAARAARADDFIRSLPAGYDTVLGDRGVALSGGQRQRIALARALLADPRVLLLDDATSAIDPKVEAEIHAALSDFMADRTVLLVAHRRSTLRLATRIAVLDDGRIADTGTHEELMSRCSLYRQLVMGDEPGLDSGEPPAAPKLSGDQNRLSAALSKQAGHADIDDSVIVAREPGAVRLRRLWKPFRGGLLAGLVLMAGDTLAQLLFPALVRSGVDEGVARADSAHLVATGLWQVGIALTAWLVIYAEVWVTGRTSERMLHVLRVKLFAHLQRLGLDFHERSSNGAILTRMTADFTTLAEFLRTGFGLAVVSVLTCLGVLGALFTVDVSLALIVFALAPVVILASVLYARNASSAYNRARSQLDRVNLGFQDSLWGARVTHAFGLAAENARRFRLLANGQFEAQMRFQRYFALFFSLIEFLSDFAIALVLAVGTGLLAAGSLTAGGLVAFCLYTGMLFVPVLQASQLLDQYQRAKTGLDRIRELLAVTPTMAEPPAEVPVGSLRGEIELDAVRYSYPGATADALAGISTRIPSGQTVAIVGESGSGKTTLMKLIARLYEPTAGAVRVDGRDLRRLPGFAYRQRLGLIPQEVYLLGRTVREAIAFGRPDAPDDKVRAAARAVQAHRMIAGLPGGFDHELSESGGNLSVGQRQLIALARAYLVDPDILLLDEATAALDLSTEAAVKAGIDRASRGRTTLVVAHRLSTARQADRILVLERGRIVEDGSHHELLARNGVYANMWGSYIAEPRGERAGSA